MATSTAATLPKGSPLLPPAPAPPTPPVPQSRFLALPTEIVIDIVAHLSDDRNALCNLARTCRFLQPLSEEHMYKSVELFSTNVIPSLLLAFAHRPARVEAVQSLKILYRYKHDLGITLSDRKALNAYVIKMKGLKDWHVESPYDNFKWGDVGHEWVDHDMEHFRKALENSCLHSGQPLCADVGLARLEKFVLHSHGPHSDFWNLGGFHCLFRHPSLRYLHVSCVNLDCGLSELENYQGTTPLTTLIFDECDIWFDSLMGIMRTPKSLKSLTLGENVHNKRDRLPSPKLSAQPEVTLEALAPVAHSLETLVHFHPSWSTNFDPENSRMIKLHGDGMRKFHALKYLECDPCSFFFRGVLLNPTLAPPNLDTFRMRRPRTGVEGNFFDQLPDINPYLRLPSLKTFELVQPSDDMISPWAISNYVCECERVRERHAHGFKLHQHGIQMKMYIEIILKKGLIPPYLHGEAVPRPLCLYDSEKVGFCRVVDDRGEDEWELDQYGPMNMIHCNQAESSLESVTERDHGPESFEFQGENYRRPTPDPTTEGTDKKVPVESKDKPSQPIITDELGRRDILQMKRDIRRTLLNFMLPEQTLDLDDSEMDSIYASDSDDGLDLDDEFPDDLDGLDEDYLNHLEADEEFLDMDFADTHDYFW
ncbi:uncharacterized protein BDR25DRAFT_316598 [Lindgomyces ingoldianus]|uniref:Uncharacterized protein n=1 Tax=Lindgomyces ingoldianus TaxID=673940 RepID=A0ACB6QPG0_9PLEO|nr:uncharacterized protein BDR25DRAFT_316598 [Lindgomyces ingoldianus]KAF2468005.1 hypothetical protein BDR25DRAFT_316598 [Lindgomyces ingoldianus]